MHALISLTKYMSFKQKKQNTILQRNLKYLLKLAGDIKYERCWEYERYGIILSNELLQMYIQRVFSDMTQYEYVPVNRNSENKTFRENLDSYINALAGDKFTSLIQTISSTWISRTHLVIEEIFEMQIHWFLKMNLCLFRKSMLEYLERC